MRSPTFGCPKTLILDFYTDQTKTRASKCIIIHPFSWLLAEHVVQSKLCPKQPVKDGLQRTQQRFHTIAASSGKPWTDGVCFVHRFCLHSWPPWGDAPEFRTISLHSFCKNAFSHCHFKLIGSRLDPRVHLRSPVQAYPLSLDIKTPKVPDCWTFYQCLSQFQHWLIYIYLPCFPRRHPSCFDWKDPGHGLAWPAAQGAPWPPGESRSWLAGGALLGRAITGSAKCCCPNPPKDPKASRR